MLNSPILVLTRPRPASLRVLSQVERVIGRSLRSVVSPALEILDVGVWPVVPNDTDVILTSEHAARGDLSGVRAHCVGVRTATAAEAKGANVITKGSDAEDLIGKLAGRPAGWSFVHLCGSHKAVDITLRLQSMGYRCEDHQVYSQIARPLSEDARAALEGEEPAVLPLFSPRSARLVGEAIAKPGPQLHVIAMSDAIAAEWRDATGNSADVVDTPTGDAMVRGIVAAFGGHAA